MTLRFDAFRASLPTKSPPADLPAPLAALWWASRGRDGWEQAHFPVQDDPGSEAAWVHAYLHRVEGDGRNATYWYARAGRPAADGPLDDEREAIARALLVHG